MSVWVTEMFTSVPEVSISSNEKYLFAEIDDGSGVSFAFYVYRDNKKIHTQWYSSAQELVFEHGGMPGVYRVTGFIRNNDAKTIMKSSRNCIIFGGKVNAHEIDFSILKDEPLLVRSGNYDFYCLFKRGVEKRLFVLLTAAINRPCPVPAFNRWKWRDRFPGSVLCISDPTLLQSEVLGIGWYLGCEENDATSDMAELVGIFATGLGISAGNIIPYGSSAGGFSAMSLASRIPGAMAVAINPQTDATKYKARRVAEMIAHCFPGLTLDDVRQRYRSRVDMTSAIPQSDARVIIVQNMEDHEHWEPHFLPFANSTGLPFRSGKSSDGRHASIVYSHENGHASETSEVFEQIIELIVGMCEE